MSLRFTFYFILFFLFHGSQVVAQQAVLSGKIKNEQGEGIAGALLYTRPESQILCLSGANGDFKTTLNANKTLTLVVNALGYSDYVFQLTLTSGEEKNMIIVMKELADTLQTTQINAPTNDNQRTEVSALKIDPKLPKYLPSAFNDFNKILAISGMGVVTNSELSSQYSVRGGNFDENLVYVNGMEVYRPFLVRAGQQEGLSFVNPDLVGDIQFYAGGWQARYGDKLSSVLAIKYREPKRFKGSATLGLLSSSVHVENRTRNRRFSYLIGARQKSAQYLLRTLPTKGEYKPRFYDLQSLFSFDLSKRRDSNDFTKRTTLSVLLSYAINRYQIIPAKRETTFGTQSQGLRLEVDFDGQELLTYNTAQNSVSFWHQHNAHLQSEITASHIQSTEREYFDIESFYKLCDVDVDPNSVDFNNCIFTKGSGSIFHHGRNRLNVSIYSLSYKGLWKKKNQALEFGFSQSREKVTDQLSEYKFEDSSAYVTLTETLTSSTQLESYRSQAFVQHAVEIDSVHFFTYGIRGNFWTLNRQLLISPRLQYAYKPRWKRDMFFRLASGIYQQPAFYRELRDFSGTINTHLQAQVSYHFIGGMDYNFSWWGRKFKFIGEAYYKHLNRIVPYDMDNVRLRYYGQNNGKAYVVGSDFRLSGEFVKGLESWFGLSFMSTREDISGDNRGYLRRPTDQRVTASILFQDHIPNNPTLRVFLNLVYGSGLPFGVPGRPELRAVLAGTAYRRVDIGFSKLISLQDKDIDRKKAFESLWVSVEILNLLASPNTISYTWISDYNNSQYAVPNTLSARFVNARLIARF